MMPMVLEVARKAKTDFKTEGDGTICLHAPTDLFKTITTVSDNYNQARYEIVLRGSLSLCFKLTQNFQREFMTVIDSDGELGLEILIATTNSSLKFIGNTKNFIKVLSKTSGTKLDKLDGMYSTGNIIKVWANLSNSAFQRVQAKMCEEIADGFLAIPNHQDWDLQKHLMTWYGYIKNNEKKLVKAFRKKLLPPIWDEFTNLYCQFIIAMSKFYEPKETRKFDDKVDKEVEMLCDIIKSEVPEQKFKIIENKLLAMGKIFSHPGPEMMDSIIKLKISLKENFNQNCIMAILRLRTDIQGGMKMAMIDF
jgi:hypothetical protein